MGSTGVGDAISKNIDEQLELVSYLRQHPNMAPWHRKDVLEALLYLAQRCQKLEDDRDVSRWLGFSDLSEEEAREQITRDRKRWPSPLQQLYRELWRSIAKG